MTIISQRDCSLLHICVCVCSLVRYMSEEAYNLFVFWLISVSPSYVHFAEREVLKCPIITTLESVSSFRSTTVVLKSKFPGLGTTYIPCSHISDVTLVSFNSFCVKVYFE